MTASLTIRNAEVVLPKSIQRVDVSVIGGRINAIGNDIEGVGKLIDAEGLTLLPGMIDPQVHFREPGAEQKEDYTVVHVLRQQGVLQVFLICRIILPRS